MKYRITSPATTDPVSLTEAKLHLRVDSSADDELIRNLVHAATVWCERYEGRAYCVQTITAKMDKWTDEIVLPVAPLLKVDSVSYIDTAGTTQTLASTFYNVDTTREPGRITLAYQKTWPALYAVPDAITIVYKVGYATSFASVVPTSSVTNSFTINEVVFSDADAVRLSNDLGDLPASLTESKTYYVRDLSGSTLNLALTAGGTKVSITDTGTGVSYIGKPDVVPSRVRAAIKLLVGHLYEHRLSVCEENYEEVPMSVKSLLMERVWPV